MKYSQFNSVVRINDSIFLHNTYTDKMMGITAETELIINAAKHEGFDEVGLYKPKFYKALVDNQFLVEDEVDEVQLIKDLQVYIDNDVTSYSLTINPTMNCNFKCWYCYESHVKSSKMDEEIVRRLKSFIIQTIEKNKHLKYFNISWFGGEPLLYFYDIIEPMLRFVSEIQSKTTVTFRTVNGK